MKSGKPNEPKNKARLRMEALQAARGIPKKRKSSASKVAATKKEVLPAKKASAPKTESVSKSKKAVPKKKVSPVKKATVSKKKIISKAKEAAPTKAKVSKARITTKKKANHSVKSKKSS